MNFPVVPEVSTPVDHTYDVVKSKLYELVPIKEGSFPSLLMFKNKIADEGLSLTDIEISRLRSLWRHEYNKTNARAVAASFKNRDIIPAESEFQKVLFKNGCFAKSALDQAKSRWASANDGQEPSPAKEDREQSPKKSENHKSPEPAKEVSTSPGVDHLTQEKATGEAKKVKKRKAPKPDGDGFATPTKRKTPPSPKYSPLKPMTRVMPPTMVKPYMEHLFPLERKQVGDRIGIFTTREIKCGELLCNLPGSVMNKQTAMKISKGLPTMWMASFTFNGRHMVIDCQSTKLNVGCQMISSKINNASQKVFDYMGKPVVLIIADKFLEKGCEVKKNMFICKNSKMVSV